MSAEAGMGSRVLGGGEARTGGGLWEQGQGLSSLRIPVRCRNSPLSSPPCASPGRGASQQRAGPSSSAGTHPGLRVLFDT